MVVGVGVVATGAIVATTLWPPPRRQRGLEREPILAVRAGPLTIALALVVPHAVRWTEARVREQLNVFLAGRSVWPTRKKFEAAGRKTLRDAVGRTGGIEMWAAEFDLPVQDLRRGSRRVWDDARIEAELRRFLGDRDDWPTTAEFERAGLDSLRSAIYRHGGGTRRWARRLGVRRPRHGRSLPRGRFWTDERIESELCEFTAAEQSWPGWLAFDRGGRAPLYRAASLYGGIPRWRRRLGL